MTAVRLTADERRRQLLDTACGVFAAHGFHATSMDDVATAAGVTKPVLYQHFESKRGLYLALLHDAGARLLEELHTATSVATTGRARVESGFAAYYRFAIQQPSAFQMLFGASARNDVEFAAVVTGVLDAAATTVSALLELPAAAEHRRVLAHALIGVAEATSRDALAATGRADADQLARWVSELAWFGLRGIRADLE